MSNSESNDEDEVFTDSLTLHMTINDSSGTESSFLSRESLKQNHVQDISIPQSKPESIIESQFSSWMPYLKGSDQCEVTKDSVFVPVENESRDEEIRRTTWTKKY